MFQVTFSDQAMGELNKLDVPTQLLLIDRLGSVSEEQLAHPVEPLGRFTRDGRTYYRLRAGDHRGYFELRDGVLHVVYLLSRHSLMDFVFRAKLPASEEALVEQIPSFWKYLDSLKKP